MEDLHSDEDDAEPVLLAQYLSQAPGKAKNWSFRYIRKWCTCLGDY
jgi:hypothetical protein